MARLARSLAAVGAALAGALVATSIAIAGYTVPAAAAPPPGVPDVIGMQIDDALGVLEGLVRVEVLPSSMPEFIDRTLVLVYDEVDTTVRIDPGPTTDVRLVLGTRVPDLFGLTPSAAKAALDTHGLFAVVVSGDSALPDVVVRGQEVAPGTLVALASKVPVSLVQLARVPAISGLSVADAREIIESSGLLLRVAAIPSGRTLGTIESQDPPAGTLVEPGTTVTAYPSVVVTSPPTPSTTAPSTTTPSTTTPSITATPSETVLPPVTVAVPDVSGLSPDDARRAMDDAQLDLAASIPTDGSGAVAVRQDPTPGVRVAVGTTVSVWFEVAGAARTSPPWWLIAALAGGVLVVSGAAYVPLRRAGARRWVRAHVRVLGYPGAQAPSAGPVGSGERWDVRLEPHPDAGRQSVEEVRP